MESHAEMCVERYCELAHTTVDQLHKFSTRLKINIRWPSVRLLNHIRLCQLHGLVRDELLHPIATLTGAEIISLDARSRMEGIPAMNLWDTMIDISKPCPSNSDPQTS